MRYPVNYISITNPFGNGHKGMDLGWYSVLHHHQPIYSVWEGEVIYFKVQPKGGNCIHIRHKIGDEYFVSEYGHLQNNSIKVKVGQKVSMGQKIAKMGDTGVVDGEHLHFGLCKGEVIHYNSTDKWVNPIDYLEVYSNQKVKDKTIKNYGKELIYHKDIPEKGVYKTLYDMNIRKSPNGIRAKVKDCTDAMKKALTSKKTNDYAVIKKGTKITILDVIDINGYWGKNYSGYVCIEKDGTTYCKKV